MTANDVYDAIKQGDFPKATSRNYKWIWTLNGRSVTRQVNTLIKQKRVTVTYLSRYNVALGIND